MGSDNNSNCSGRQDGSDKCCREKTEGLVIRSCKSDNLVDDCDDENVQPTFAEKQKKAAEFREKLRSINFGKVR